MAIRSARLSNVPYRQKIPLYTLCSNAFRKTGMWKLTTSSIRDVTVGIIASLRTAGYRRPWFTGRSCQDADCRSGCRERKGAAEDDQKRAFRSVDCNSRRICSAHCGSSGVVRDHYGRGSPSLARGSDHKHHCRRNRDSRCRNCQYCGLCGASVPILCRRSVQHWSRTFLRGNRNSLYIWSSSFLPLVCKKAFCITE